MLGSKVTNLNMIVRQMASAAASAGSASTPGAAKAGAAAASNKYAGWISPNGVVRLPEGRIWNSWKEVPDELVEMFPIRDKTNPIYRHPRYIKYRKLQIFFQQNDGIECWRKMGTRDMALFRLMQVCYFSALIFALYHLYMDILRVKK